jgi:hypothetical protein
MTQLLPDLSSLYSLSDGALIGLLMNAVADEVEEGIDRRLTDIEEMCVILDSARAYLEKNDLGVLETELTSMKLSAVDARHDGLTRLLITIHAKSESESGLAAINQEIWAYLRRHAERHLIIAVP